MGYHFYTIHSMEPLILAARAQGHSVADLERFMRMYAAPLSMAFDDGQFPGNNDGWSGSNLYTQPQYYEVAAAIEARPEFVGMLARAYKGRPRNSTDALLYGPDAIPAAGVVVAEEQSAEGVGDCDSAEGQGQRVSEVRAVRGRARSQRPAEYDSVSRRAGHRAGPGDQRLRDSAERAVVPFGGGAQSADRRWKKAGQLRRRAGRVFGRSRVGERDEGV